jgi:hypothetical protein
MRIKEALFELLYADKHISTEDDAIFSGEDGRFLKKYVYSDKDLSCNEVNFIKCIRQAGCELVIRKGDKEYKIDGNRMFDPRSEESDRELNKWLKEVNNV